MDQNVGTLDRVLRMAIGIALLLASVLVKEPIGWLGLIGFIPLLSGMFGSCPLYDLLGINTCESPKAKV